MDDATMTQVLASPAAVTTGMTVAQVVDSALSQIANPNDLKALIDARVVQASLASAKAAAPTIPAPANAAAIATYLLTASATPSYAEAYLTLKHAAQGFLASPQTNTWDDVFKALVILPTVLLKATPHLAEL